MAKTIYSDQYHAAEPSIDFGVIQPMWPQTNFPAAAWARYPSLATVRNFFAPGAPDDMPRYIDKEDVGFQKLSYQNGRTFDLELKALIRYGKKMKSLWPNALRCCYTPIEVHPNHALTPEGIEDRYTRHAAACDVAEAFDLIGPSCYFNVPSPTGLQTAHNELYVKSSLYMIQYSAKTAGPGGCEVMPFVCDRDTLSPTWDLITDDELIKDHFRELFDFGSHGLILFDRTQLGANLGGYGNNAVQVQAERQRFYDLANEVAAEYA